MRSGSDYQILAELREAGRQFHPVAQERGGQWQLDDGSVDLLVSAVGEGDRTLETGCGHSTIAFALCGAHHTAISPTPAEQESLESFCRKREIPLDRLTMILGHSQEILPGLEPTTLDFVLIDGAHAFPVPFIDWYYAARRLKVGGLMMIDDTQIRTGRILTDFLESEVGRWRLLERRPSLVMFEKTAEPTIPAGDWPDQPYCANPERVPGLGPSTASRLRGAVRLRSRLRQVLGRPRTDR
ncbi:MAG: class I SAM-dependent methyltransferase [Solirubrobacterales bacterium]